LMRFAIICIGAVWMACGHAPKTTEKLMGAVRGYNEDLRWHRITAAASHIPPKERELFLDERDDLEKELRIDDYEVGRVALGKKGDRAVVHVRYTWHMDNRGIVHTTIAAQLWERRGSRWWMAEERRVRGKTMPGVPEPAKKRLKAQRAARAR
jgi:hypothetical protein